MRILKYNGKLVEETGHVPTGKVVFMRYLLEKDMPKCECGRSIDKEMAIVEGTPHWETTIEGVDTLEKQTSFVDNSTNVAKFTHETVTPNEM